MKLQFDDTILDATDRYLAAVDELARAQAEMLAAALGSPEDWEAGRVTIGNLANSGHLRLEFGGSEENLTPEGQDILLVSIAEKGGTK